MRSSRFFLAGALAIAALAFLFSGETKHAAYDFVTHNMFVESDNDSFDPGPAIGSRFPGFNALYQGQNTRLLTPFSGPNGTILVALRSLDWCPFCMKQLIQLEAEKATFDAAGINLVAITYDPPTTQQQFIEQQGITIPVLSDIDATTFKTLGILNTDYQPGDDSYGIPFPGMIVVDNKGTVVGKLFIEAYSSRVNASAALDYALKALGQH